MLDTYLQMKLLGYLITGGVAAVVMIVLIIMMIKRR